ncbi:helix-turn-helix domain-containing protein [Macrococcoides bohemicum]|uniref:helix-turn-helix domain-containing protein n=1 Tax=Macrococcoides bohemicum TaxID=1903056 RepID=UPI00165DC043|nr:helix-turn-helix transcriptional regulator [Macrococcus bohemicus]MBC9873543.1 helix-turn-helix transcriptional regulator [Macrococcus bohemicus]
MDNLSVATALRWHRENREYSAKEVAAHIGITPSIYSKIESGNRVVTVPEFKRIAELYGMTMEELCVIPSRKKRLS